MPAVYYKNVTAGNGGSGKTAQHFVQYIIAGVPIPPRLMELMEKGLQEGTKDVAIPFSVPLIKPTIYKNVKDPSSDRIDDSKKVQLSKFGKNINFDAHFYDLVGQPDKKQEKVNANFSENAASYTIVLDSRNPDFDNVVNFWLPKVVFQADTIDDWLEAIVPKMQEKKLESLIKLFTRPKDDINTSVGAGFMGGGPTDIRGLSPEQAKIEAEKQVKKDVINSEHRIKNLITNAENSVITLYVSKAMIKDSNVNLSQVMVGNYESIAPYLEFAKKPIIIPLKDEHGHLVDKKVKIYAVVIGDTLGRTEEVNAADLFRKGESFEPQAYVVFIDGKIVKPTRVHTLAAQTIGLMKASERQLNDDSKKALNDLIKPKELGS